MPAFNYHNVVDHIDEYIVLVDVDHRKQVGTGFFVGSGLILTCAHVILLDEGTGPLGSCIRVSWNGKGTVEAQTRYCSNSNFPDVALLQVEDWKDNKSLIFGTNPKLSETLSEDYFAKGFPDGGPASPVRLTLEGYRAIGFDVNSNFVDHDALGNSRKAEVLSFKDSIIQYGMSGGPIINKKHGQLCGMIRETKSNDFPLGGFGIPVEVIFRELVVYDKDLFPLLTLSTELEASINRKNGTIGLIKNDLEKLYEVFEARYIRPDHCDRLQEALVKLEAIIHDIGLPSIDVHRFQDISILLKAPLNRLRDICWDQDKSLIWEKRELIDQVIKKLKAIRDLVI